MEQPGLHETGEQEEALSERDEFLEILRQKTDEELKDMIIVVNLEIAILKTTGGRREEIASKIITRCRLYYELNSYERRFPVPPFINS
jgi:hypothetical protein